MAVKPPSESAYRKETKIVIYEEGKRKNGKKEQRMCPRQGSPTPYKF